MCKLTSVAFHNTSNYLLPRACGYCTTMLPLANIGRIFRLNSALRFSGDLWVEGRPELSTTVNVNQLGLTEDTASHILGFNPKADAFLNTLLAQNQFCFFF